jgi:hypothetical protein
LMMKKACLILMMFVLLIPSPKKARACDSCLIHEADSQVTYDCLTGRYWYYDLVRFTNMTYLEQIAEIRTIRVQGFPGHWHMATYEQIEELWSHSAETILSSFALTRDNPLYEGQYSDGRYDERAGTNSHCIAEVRRRPDQTYEKSILDHMSAASDDDRFQVLGAWVVYEGESNDGPTSAAGRILPAIMLLLSDPDGSGGHANGFPGRGEGVPRR